MSRCLTSVNATAIVIIILKLDKFSSSFTFGAKEEPILLLKFSLECHLVTIKKPVILATKLFLTSNMQHLRDIGKEHSDIPKTHHN